MASLVSSAASLNSSSSTQNIPPVEYRYSIIAFDYSSFITDRYIHFLDKVTGNRLKRRVIDLIADEAFFAQLCSVDAYRIGFMAGEASTVLDEIKKVLGSKAY